MSEEIQQSNSAQKGGRSSRKRKLDHATEGSHRGTGERLKKQKNVKIESDILDDQLQNDTAVTAQSVPNLKEVDDNNTSNGDSKKRKRTQKKAATVPEASAEGDVEPETVDAPNAAEATANRSQRFIVFIGTLLARLPLPTSFLSIS